MEKYKNEYLLIPQVSCIPQLNITYQYKNKATNTLIVQRWGEAKTSCFVLFFSLMKLHVLFYLQSTEC